MIIVEMHLIVKLGTHADPLELDHVPDDDSHVEAAADDKEEDNTEEGVDTVLVLVIMMILTLTPFMPDEAQEANVGVAQDYDGEDNPAVYEDKIIESSWYDLPY